MSTLIYRRAFGDGFGIKELSNGNIPKISDVKRRIFVSERRSDAGRPDHFYKNYLDARLAGIDQIHDLPLGVLSALAKHFLTRSGGNIHIRTDAFEDWRELLPMISPLAVIIAFLVNEGRGPAHGDDPRAYLAAQLGGTALIYPHQQEVQHLIERDGLNEMHMHLNGSTELDILWPDAVRSPDTYLRELNVARTKTGGPTDEFYDQLELGLTPYDFYRRLRSARRVRHLVARLLDNRINRRKSETNVSMQAMLETMNVHWADSTCCHTTGLPLAHHPISRIFPGKLSSPLVDEAAFLYTWFQALGQPNAPRAELGLALYFNMLVLTQVARISVQQIDEVGFDQFQKYTLVGVREHLESVYDARFRQLNGQKPYTTLRHLEGRLAPKKDVATFLSLIEAVVDGYLRFRGCPARASVKGLRGDAPGCITGGCRGNCRGDGGGRADSELALVVHFIKRPPSKSGKRASQALDLVLRSELRQQAQVVRQAVERHRLVRQILRGMDAAANELHAAPEVFAPTFRYLRHHCIENATYHVGEDFIHLVSGIRSCAEARLFLPLGAGDRMGHATALGIRPDLWLSRTGPRLMVSRGEHLDNLVYAHRTLLGNPEIANEAKTLEGEISELALAIYGQEHSPTLLHQAWLCRDLDILEILELERDMSDAPSAAAIATAATGKSGRINAPARRFELARIADVAKQHPQAYALFRKRHTLGKSLLELCEVKADWLDRAALTRLQSQVLSDLAASGVALETLPTSNVRISSYNHLSEHHLFRWLGLTDDGFKAVPAICVGSDDTGILATSLRNEYSAIYDVLRNHFLVSAQDAINLIDKLNQNGAAYRFRPIAPPR
ncbi:hypothetical protein [Phyllobacterium leguminum]|uniref:Adenosine deaminase domain-containing protein n=1 Tax=Phyllobacterium leguminum TaxID=314237 RepID=A0A318SY14_9HYPH|nr:hypothetical protein [Phyllobacterium leguminum]PYE85226.1 hypothetical protein C7477_1355 [Phyllobacterium leguminum]